MTRPLTAEECFGFEYSAVKTGHFQKQRHGGGLSFPLHDRCVINETGKPDGQDSALCGC